MPRIVTLPIKVPPPRKRRGRGLEAVLASHVVEPPPAYHGGLRDHPHLSYNPRDPNRAEHARALSPWARKIVDVPEFGTE